MESFGSTFAGSTERGEPPDVVVLHPGVNDDTLTAAQYGDYLALMRAAYGDSKIAALSPFSGKHSSTVTPRSPSDSPRN